jgi:predicted TIM-barrel fold metal-dependent hydrolase
MAQIHPKSKVTQEQIDRFLERAKAQISDNAETRLSQPVKQVLEAKNFIFDAHAHFFDGECINVLYMLIRLITGLPAPLAYFLVKRVTKSGKLPIRLMLSTDELIEYIYENWDIIERNANFDEFIDKLIEVLEKYDYNLIHNLFRNPLHKQGVTRILIARLIDILNLVKSRQMLTVYESFRNDYSIDIVYNKKYNDNKQLLTVALGMDLNSGWQDKVKKKYEQQNAELLQLSTEQPILPYFPIDPRRAELDGDNNLYEAFLKAFSQQSQQQFFGVKCYPALGYMPGDFRLSPIFKICAEKNIPIVTHCGGEVVSTFEKKIPVFEGTIHRYIQEGKRKNRAYILNNPQNWESVLKANPNLRLNLGHFGSGKAWEGHDPGFRISYILSRMTVYPNLYADFSFNLESKIATQNFQVELSRGKDKKIMQERSLFGTDFWVILPMSNLIKDQEFFLNEIGKPLSKALLIDNVLNYLGINS